VMCLQIVRVTQTGGKILQSTTEHTCSCRI